MKADWVKVHAMCGVKTNVLTAVKILDKDAADGPQLPDLAKTMAQGFTVHEVATDKGYTSTENFQTVEDLGGVLYSAFRGNATGGVGGIFRKAFHYFCRHRDEFLLHYHKRSNFESGWSALKRKLGDSVRGKTDTSMRNEVLAKVVC